MSHPCVHACRGDDLSASCGAQGSRLLQQSSPRQGPRWEGGWHGSAGGVGDGGFSMGRSQPRVLTPWAARRRGKGKDAEEEAGTGGEAAPLLSVALPWRDSLSLAHHLRIAGFCLFFPQPDSPSQRTQFGGH